MVLEKITSDGCPLTYLFVHLLILGNHEMLKTNIMENCLFSICSAYLKNIPYGSKYLEILLKHSILHNGILTREILKGHIYNLSGKANMPTKHPKFLLHGSTTYKLIP